MGEISGRKLPRFSGVRGWAFHGYEWPPRFSVAQVVEGTVTAWAFAAGDIRGPVDQRQLPSDRWPAWIPNDITLSSATTWIAGLVRPGEIQFLTENLPFFHEADHAIHVLDGLTPVADGWLHPSPA